MRLRYLKSLGKSATDSGEKYHGCIDIGVGIRQVAKDCILIWLVESVFTIRLEVSDWFLDYKISTDWVFPPTQTPLRLIKAGSQSVHLEAICGSQ